MSTQKFALQQNNSPGTQQSFVVHLNQGYEQSGHHLMHHCTSANFHVHWAIVVYIQSTSIHSIQYMSNAKINRLQKNHMH